WLRNAWLEGRGKLSPCGKVRQPRYELRRCASRGGGWVPAGTVVLTLCPFPCTAPPVPLSLFLTPCPPLVVPHPLSPSPIPGRGDVASGPAFPLSRMGEGVRG